MESTETLSPQQKAWITRKARANNSEYVSPVKAKAAKFTDSDELTSAQRAWQTRRQQDIVPETDVDFFVRCIDKVVDGQMYMAR